jgi:hypothetical protein
MARPLKDPLRALSETERTELDALSRSRSAPADRIARALQILAVADGANLQQAVRRANRHSRQALARLIRRFNHEGLNAISGHHGGGPAVRYGKDQQERILQEFARTPDREKDQTATAGATSGCGWAAHDQHLCDLSSASPGRLYLAEGPYLVRHRHRRTQT